MERDRKNSLYDDSETCPHLHSGDCSAFKEEMSAELSAPAAPHSYSTLSRTQSRRHDESIRATRAAGQAAGWAGLVIAVMSLLIWPVLLGLSAAFIGYVAFRQGSRGLGIWSITLGLIAAATYLVLIPLYYAYAAI